MSWRVNCRINALIERFSRSLKVEWVPHHASAHLREKGIKC